VTFGNKSLLNDGKDVIQKFILAVWKRFRSNYW